jgi:methyl-accepting chemotaxis protein
MIQKSNIENSNAIFQQFKRVNKFTTIVFSVLTFYILGTIGNTILYGSKNVKDIFIPLILFIIGMTLNIYTYGKENSKLVRYTSILTYLSITSYLLFYGLNASTYIYLFPALLIIILYFDFRFSLIFSGIIIFINIMDIVLLLNADKNAVFTLDSSYAVQLFGIVVCSLIACSISRIAKSNNENIINEIEEEKLKQENLTNKIMQIADKMNDKISSTDSIISELNASNDAVNNSVKEITESTQSNAKSIIKQTEMTQNIQGIIEVTDNNANQMKGLADKSRIAVKEGLDIIEDLKGQASNLDEANQTVAGVMDSLEVKMQEVQNITEVILGISSQTDLLALNASIEAARAGDQGKGFAVVADQIRKLADETRKSTESIKSLITQLNANAVGAKSAASNVQTVSREQIKLIENAQLKFSNINHGVVDLASLIINISKTINEIKLSNNNIVDSVSHLSATSEEVTASSEQAYELCSHSAECVKKESDLLRELEELAKQFKQYKID